MAALSRFWVGVFALFVVTVAGTLVTIAVLPAAVSPWTATAVGSGSMRPALRPGDIVVLEPPGPEALGPPTIVLIERPR